MESTTVFADHFHGFKPEFSIYAIDSGLATGLISRPDADLVREFIAEREKGGPKAFTASSL